VSGFTTHVDGIGFWASGLPDWPSARSAFRGEAGACQPPQPIPPPRMLSAPERRRAPQTVALALAASEEAVQASGQDPGRLRAVFCSAHGDLPVIDHLCTTLAQAPLLVSPTRFLHSIHNAPVGLWSMLKHNTHANAALCGAAHSFASGLLEALVLSEAEQCPVLLTAYDTAAVGALRHTTRSEGALALALVLSPHCGGRSQAVWHWHLRNGAAEAPPLRSAEARNLSANGMAPALPVFEALAHSAPATLELPLSAHQSLRLEWASRAPEAREATPAAAVGGAP
jgi:Beta-ketoacyl synthase, N-terminal domain